MGVHIQSLLIFVFIKCAFSTDALVEPCNHTDVDCFKELVVSFYTKISSGMPEYGMTPIDPLELTNVKYADAGSDIIMQLENIRIEGFKNQKLNDFKLITDTKLVTFCMTVVVDIVANVSIKLNDATELLSGRYGAKATSVQTVRYFYDLKVSSDGMEHFIFGPETIDCEPVGVPEVTLDLQYSNTVAKDSDVVARKADYLKRATEIKHRPICMIISEAYKEAMSQVRRVIHALPKTAFFKNL